jgi:hypothetical protein
MLFGVCIANACICALSPQRSLGLRLETPHKKPQSQIRLKPVPRSNLRKQHVLVHWTSFMIYVLESLQVGLIVRIIHSDMTWGFISRTVQFLDTGRLIRCPWFRIPLQNINARRPRPQKII